MRGEQIRKILNCKHYSGTEIRFNHTILPKNGDQNTRRGVKAEDVAWVKGIW